MKSGFHLFIVFRLLHSDETVTSSAAASHIARVCYCTIFARIKARVKISMDKCINAFVVLYRLWIDL